MNPAAAARRTAERLSGISRQQLMLRAGIGLGTLAVLVVTALTGGTLSLFWSPLVGLAALVTMLIPHDFAPLVLVTGLALLWAVSVPDVADPSAVVVAALLFGIHVVCALTSYGPPEVVLDRALLLVWVRRSVLATGAAVAVWLASWVLPLGDRPGNEWVRVAALGLLLGWTGFLTTRLLRPAS